MNNIQDDIAAQQAGIVNYRAPSYGKFSTSLTTSYWFGTPRNVSASGLAMDVDKVFSTTVDKNNNAQAWVNFNQLVGNRYSAMEHLVPEQMFSTEEAPAEGISAVKAIAIAGAQGQKIWTITQDNLDVALAAINLDSASETEIRNGVNAGKVVTTHEQSINFNGWVGEGYIILDPETGAGAYKIAGGGNGGFINVLDNLGSFLSFYSVLISVSKAVTGALGNWVSIASNIVSLLTIMTKCSNGVLGLIIALTIMTILAAFFAFILTGGVFAFLAGNVARTILTYASNKLMEVMIEHGMSSRGC